MKTKRWIRMIALCLMALIGFGYLQSHGISPVWIAVGIVLFPGLLRFIYRVACFLVSAAIVIAILGFVIF